jgi:cathepsin L
MSSYLLSGLILLANYTFTDYLLDNKIVINKSEYASKKIIFEKELARVIEHNSKSLPWKETLNQMSISSPVYGFDKNMKILSENKKYQYAFDLTLDSVDNLPKSVDWREKGVVSAVKDQGYCGSCWAFASTAVIESHVALETGKLFDLSPQQIASCSPNPKQCGGKGNCEGATAEIAFDYVASSEGLLEEFQYSYSSFYGVESSCSIPPAGVPKAHIDGYVKLPSNDYKSLMNAVAKIGPIAISVDASSWHAYSSGIFNGCNQVNPDINHAVVLVGYGEENGQKYWLVRNSWSASWGENGYIRLNRDENICGTDITPQNGSACEGETEPVQACGTCGILFDSAYPIGASL